MEKRILTFLKNPKPHICTTLQRFPATFRGLTAESSYMWGVSLLISSFQLGFAHCLTGPRDQVAGRRRKEEFPKKLKAKLFKRDAA